VRFLPDSLRVQGPLKVAYAIGGLSHQSIEGLAQAESDLDLDKSNQIPVGRMGAGEL
jgi:hypothetical protein